VERAPMERRFSFYSVNQSSAYACLQRKSPVTAPPSPPWSGSGGRVEPFIREHAVPPQEHPKIKAKQPISKTEKILERIHTAYTNIDQSHQCEHQKPPGVKRNDVTIIANNV